MKRPDKEYLMCELSISLECTDTSHKQEYLPLQVRRTVVETANEVNPQEVVEAREVVRILGQQGALTMTWEEYTNIGMKNNTQVCDNPQNHLCGDVKHLPA